MHGLNIHRGKNKLSPVSLSGHFWRGHERNTWDFCMETLILTGWGWNDYACAAALALRHIRRADILGMSTRRLPEFLNEVTGYKNILILGIGLAGAPELLRKAVDKLDGRGVKLRWISALPFPENLPEALRDKLDPFIDDAGVTMAVSRCFRISGDDLVPLIQQKEPPSGMRHYQQLLEAAMYVYRNYQDERAYGEAIRHIAWGDPESKWSEAEKRMLEHFKRFGNRELVGKSEAIQKLLARINLIAPRDHARVLIFGESGTGKETVALQLHNKSPRRNEPYIAFNCASVTPNLLESRFFGHERGAFTGATEKKRGLFEQADGGTLFLDEIGELPLEAQGILLRVLEGGRVVRLGSAEEIEVNVRLIAATNRDLAAMVRDGKFREDLFHRLNVVQIRVPPLREHKSDIAQIADGYWLRQHRRRLNPEQIEALKQYEYPGNVRELFNLLERASVLEQMDFSALIMEHKQMTASLNPDAVPEAPDELEAAIRLHVRRVYEKYNCNLTHAAGALKVARNTVRKYLEER